MRAPGVAAAAAHAEDGAVRVSDGRLWALQLVVAVALVALSVQLVRMHLVELPVAPEGTDALSVRDIPVDAPRGLVLDRDGEVLARNVPRFTVAIVPGELPADASGRRAALMSVEAQTGVPLRTLERAISTGLANIDPLVPVEVHTGFALQDAIALRAALSAVPGVLVQTRAMRLYGGGELLGHILGHVGPIPAESAEEYLSAGYRLDERVGQSGVEAIYESELRGELGRRVVLADPTGREVDQLTQVDAVAGADLVLSIDLDLQLATAEALERGLDAGLEAALSRPDRHDQPLERVGAAVVIDVRTGELLALVSSPSYDANAFSGLSEDADRVALLTHESRPLVHRAYQEVRSPGSIFKPLVGAAALQEGIATPSTRIRSTGALTVQSIYDPEVTYTFRDWTAPGVLDFYGGLVRSSDVYYYYLSGGYDDPDGSSFEGLGVERIARYVREFGLGAATGLDLPGEAGGLVPDGAWKEATYGEPWVLGDTYTLGIGQGYLTVTPLQMAVAAAAIANGGEVLVPRVARGFRVGDDVELLAKQVAGLLPIDAEHLDVVREAMKQTADGPLGTARRGEPEGITIAGKTGTAEFGPQHPDDEFDTHGWFIAFAPYDEPEVALAVYLNHGSGALHAAPVAHDIFEAYFHPPTARVGPIGAPDATGDTP